MAMLESRKLRRRDAGERGGLEVEWAVFLEQRNHPVGRARADLEAAHTILLPVWGELQILFLLAYLAEAFRLRRAAPARDHSKCPTLSQHDAEFQHLLIVGACFLGIFHFFPSMPAVQTGCLNGLQPSLRTKGLPCGKMGVQTGVSELPTFTIAHAPSKPARVTRPPARKRL
jgi:hypothetical protein